MTISVDRLDAPLAPEIRIHSTTQTLAIDLLERRCGPRWPELPAGLGRAALRSEEVLARPPTAIHASTAPAAVIGQLDGLVEATAVLVELVDQEGGALAAAIGTHLDDLSLERIDEIAGAVVDLTLAPSVEPAWAVPAAADAAAVVLTTVESQLRPAARLHDELYAQFTDAVLEIPEPALRAGLQGWRLVARAQLRRRLSAASRTGHLPGGLRAVATNILAVRASRLDLEALGPLLCTHLVGTGWRPLMDVDAVVTSLAAVRRYQAALGERLAVERLGSLLAARAFQSIELTHPATTLRSELVRWRAEVLAHRGTEPGACTAPELAAWAAEAKACLPALSTGALALAAIGRPPTTVGALVDDLLLRERAAEITAPTDAGEGPRREVRLPEPCSAP